MKPHEETWEHRDGSTAITWGDNENDVAVFYGRSEPSSERARLAAAAPEMARALLEVEQALGEIGWHMDRGVRMRVREALNKAGVL